MRSDAFMKLSAEAGGEAVVMGSSGEGVIVLPGAEGRIFMVSEGVVVNRVVEEELHAPRGADRLMMIGGDVLWFGPEGTPFGYFYPEGKWRFPPAVCNVRYEVTEATDTCACIASPALRARNNRGRELALRITREIRLLAVDEGTGYETLEVLEVLDGPSWSMEEVRIVPWTLSQYGATPDSRVRFRLGGGDRWTDVYSPVGEALTAEGEEATLKTQGRRVFQVLLSPGADELTLRQGDRIITKTFLEASEGEAVDIRDIDPAKMPGEAFPTCMSVYNSDRGFLELEACGRCPRELAPGTRLAMRVRNTCQHKR